jgi:hypothetical protein
MGARRTKPPLGSGSLFRWNLYQFWDPDLNKLSMQFKVVLWIQFFMVFVKFEQSSSEAVSGSNIFLFRIRQKVLDLCRSGSDWLFRLVARQAPLNFSRINHNITGNPVSKHDIFFFNCKVFFNWYRFISCDEEEGEMFSNSYLTDLKDGRCDITAGDESRMSELSRQVDLTRLRLWNRRSLERGGGERDMVRRRHL